MGSVDFWGSIGCHAISGIIASVLMVKSFPGELKEETKEEAKEEGKL